MRTKPSHEDFMRIALSEAKKGMGKTSPNPLVGALLVNRGRVLARGHHRRAGSDHAEVECLKKFAGKIPRSAILYISLEPCSTRGRTKPCVQFIVDRGVRRVAIGAIDPNPKHRGRAIALLRAAGIEVSANILSQECTELNRAFNKWIVTGLPFVITKCGMSLDGRLTRPTGESRWLTSAKSRQDAQKLRAVVGAIIVGAETIRQDNPRLTVRPPSARQPWRVVLSRSGRLPSTSRIFCDAQRERTLVYRNKSLLAVLRDLGRREITSVLIEGGGNVLSQALDKKLIDQVVIYLAPLFTGGKVLAFAGAGTKATADSLRLNSLNFQRIRNDVRVSGYAVTEIGSNK